MRWMTRIGLTIVILAGTAALGALAIGITVLTVRLVGFKGAFVVPVAGVVFCVWKLAGELVEEKKKNEDE